VGNCSKLSADQHARSKDNLLQLPTFLAEIKLDYLLLLLLIDRVKHILVGEKNLLGDFHDLCQIPICSENF